MGAIPAICLLLVLLPIVAGCSSPSAAPAAQAETVTAAQSTVTVLPAATAPAAGETATTVTEPLTDTATVTSTVADETPAPRFTPTGPPPSDPLDVLNIFGIVTPGNLAVKRDILPLDGNNPPNVLVTIAGARLGVSTPLTTENTSALGVMTYDPVFREWNLSWQSDPISGTARPLAASNQFGGTNGGDLLRDGSPILELRTTTLDGMAHLQLLRYDRNTHKAIPLKMVPSTGAPEKDALFDGELDVTVADLDDDGIYEVVADNVSGVQAWRWDGSRYIPRETR